MTTRLGPSLHSDHNSSLPGPGPGPIPPGPFFLPSLLQHLRRFDGSKFERARPSQRPRTRRLRDRSGSRTADYHPTQSGLCGARLGAVLSNISCSPIGGTNMDKPINVDTNVSTRGRNAQRVQRYRARRPRIDFYPSPDVLAILLHHRKTGADPTLAAILDGLIRIGHRFVSGNGER